MAIKLVLTDIDATILPRGEREVSARTVRAFNQALDAGLVVGPASGRGYAWIPAFFGEDARCCATALATNGLQIYSAGEKILERTLPRAALMQMREIVAETPGAGLLCFDEVRPLLVEGAVEDLAPIFPAYAQSCVPVDDVPASPVVKANVFMGGDASKTAALVARLNEEVCEVDVDRALPHFSNVMPRGWNKGTALVWLCGHLGIAPEEVVVFGDADNDLPLFAHVPHSVAVANATPEAARAARWHIGSCEDDAVAQALEVLASGGWPFEG